MIKNGRNFKGLFLDDGSPKTVCGLIEFLLYVWHYNLWHTIDIKSPSSGEQIRFRGKSNSHIKILGTSLFRLPLHPCFYFGNLVHIVDDDIPFLLGLHEQEKWRTIRDLSCMPYNLIFPLHGFTLPIVRKLNHLYIKLDTSS